MMNQLSLIVLAGLINLTYGHFFDPSLALPFADLHPPMSTELLSLHLVPAADSTFTCGISCPLVLIWDPSQPMKPEQLVENIFKCWSLRDSSIQELHAEQFASLQPSQLMTYIYRSKLYYQGDVKIEFCVEADGKKVTFTRYNPPVTPGEYECLLLHHDILTDNLNKRQEQCLRALKYLSAIGADVDEQAKILLQPFSGETSLIPARIKELEKLSTIQTKLMAKLHVDLAKSLESLRYHRSIQIAEKASGYMNVLPEVPIKRLPLNQFLEIQKFVNQHK